MFNPIRLFLSFVIIMMLVCYSVGHTQQFKIEREINFFESEKRQIEPYSPTVYNRVDGLFLSMGVHWRPRVLRGAKFSVDAGYGFSSKKWRYNVSWEKKIHSLCITAEYFDRLGCNEAWIMHPLENTFAALLFKEDFFDYYRLQGWKISLSKQVKEWLLIRGIYRSVEYDTVAKHDVWSLFGRHKKFRSNPPVAKGTENKIRLELVADFLDNPIYPMSGWYGEIALEKSGKFLNGDFDYGGIFITMKYFRRVLQQHRLVLLGRAAVVENPFGEQHLIDLGGIATLRGYRYKEFANGSRMVMISANYYLNGDLLQKLPLQWIPLYSSLGLILFAEVGSAWFPANAVPCEISVVDHPDWKTDVGVSLTVSSDFLRFDFAKRLDRRSDTWAITVRVLPRW